MLNSFEKLEVTIALYRADTHTLSAAELDTKLQLSSNLVERGIDELARAGVVQVSNEFVRLTIDPRDLPALGEIAELYEEDRLLVVQTLTEISMDKLRGMAARTFADAFRIRRKNEEDGDA